METGDLNIVSERLRNALSSGSIAPDVKATGARLLQRICAPVRVVILGPAGSGKSELLNFLASQEIVPQDATWPTLELCWGQQLQTTLTDRDGGTETIAGRALEQIAANRPAHVEVEAPLPFIENISLLEVKSGGSTLAHRDTVNWAARRADIALWCSQDFAQSEREAWSGVPDGLKDHSFFVLTQADILSSNGNLESRISQLQDVVADQFHSLIPMATLQAISATAADGRVDRSALVASGGKALVDAISHHVTMGRQADIDNARLFLRRCGLDALDAPPIAAARSDRGALAKTALAYLGERTQDLSDFDPENPGDILEFCVQTANSLGEILMEARTEIDTEMVLQDTVVQAADIMLLMKLEDGAGPAADAVTLLIQLRREFQASIAA